MAVNHGGTRSAVTSTVLPETCDVVVVGGGPGGIAAAVEAARRGASTLLVEALDEIGGSAVRSTGYVGFLQDDGNDSEELFLADMRKEVDLQRGRYGVIFDEALARLFIAQSAETFEHLADLGLRFSQVIRRPLQHSVDRMLEVESPLMFRSVLEPELAQHRVAIAVGTRVVRLLREDDGSVVGVRTSGPRGRIHEVRAQGGVVLATGGYQANAALRQRYQPERWASTPYHGAPTCRGDGHRLGQSVGGDLINMTMVPLLVMISSGLAADSIAVNSRGERFHNETGPYDDRVAALMGQPGEVGYHIWDARVTRTRSHLIADMPGALVQAGTITELAERMDLPAARLKETVDRWNGALTVVADRDPAFGRVVFPQDRRGVTEPPFTACRMVVGINFPAGGFRVTLGMQVVDVFGQAIPRLYAVGDNVGAVNVAAGLGGLHIAAALTLGRVAGQSAADPGSAPPVHDLPVAELSDSSLLPNDQRMDIVDVAPGSTSAERAQGVDTRTVGR